MRLRSLVTIIRPQSSSLPTLYLWTRSHPYLDGYPAVPRLDAAWRKGQMLQS